jgi:aspartate aminotransferase-like enzyme
MHTLQPEYQSHSSTSFRFPAHHRFDSVFYDRLSEFGFVIYPGKVSNADCFRMGTHISAGYPGARRQCPARAEMQVDSARASRSA